MAVKTDEVEGDRLILSGLLSHISVGSQLAIEFRSFHFYSVPVFFANHHVEISDLLCLLRGCRIVDDGEDVGEQLPESGEVILNV